MGLIKEFREFAIKGNAIDLAVGVIIGAAFGKIVTSLVEDLIMPPLALVTGRVNFSDLKIRLGQDLTGKPVSLDYGDFVNVIIQFLIVSFAVFLLVKAINQAKARFDEPPAAGEPVVKQCPYCLSDIPVKAVRCKFCTSELAADVATGA